MTAGDQLLQQHDKDEPQDKGMKAHEQPVPVGPSANIAKRVAISPEDLDKNTGLQMEDFKKCVFYMDLMDSPLFAKFIRYIIQYGGVFIQSSNHINILGLLLLL